MVIPRMQVFEFNDSAWAPPVVRETIVEALSRTLEWGHTLSGLLPAFEAFVAASGADELLDLASGAGGPARILVGEMLRAGRTPPRFVLTDLYPRLDAWRQTRAELPQHISFEEEPVDATRIPERVACGRPRVIINAFHHLPPPVARGVLEDAVRSRVPIFLAEGFERNPLGFLPIAVPGIAALALTPLLTPKDRVRKALLVWATPLMFAISAWDGFVSTVRIYDREDLGAMVAPFGDAFTWTYGTYPVPLGGRGCYFYGVPTSASASASS